MKIIEKWGSGLPRIFHECSEYGLPEPDFIDLHGDFRVNMYRQREGVFGGDGVAAQTTQTTQITQTDSLCFTHEDKAILALVYNQPEMTQKELALEWEWTIDRVEYYLNKMKKQQIIRRVGRSCNGHWELLIEEEGWQS